MHRLIIRSSDFHQSLVVSTISASLKTSAGGNVGMAVATGLGVGVGAGVGVFLAESGLGVGVVSDLVTLKMTMTRPIAATPTAMVPKNKDSELSPLFKPLGNVH